MSEEDLKQVSLKEFLKIVEPDHEYRNLSDYLRVYVVKDNSEYFNRCFVLTHKEYKTQIKTETKETIEKRYEISYWAEIPFDKIRLDYDKDQFLKKKEVIIFNLHSGQSETMITLLKLFDLTKSDDIWLNYYVENNSQNNEKTGLYTDTLIAYCRKYPKNGNKDAKTTYRVHIDNQYMKDSCFCSLTGGYQNMTAQSLLEHFGIDSIKKIIEHSVQKKELSEVIVA